MNCSKIIKIIIFIIINFSAARSIALQLYLYTVLPSMQYNLSSLMQCLRKISSLRVLYVALPYEVLLKGVKDTKGEVHCKRYEKRCKGHEKVCKRHKK